MLVLAYIIRKMPFTVRSVFTSVIQRLEELEEAARSLGARRARVIRRMVLPLVWYGIVAEFLLSSIYTKRGKCKRHYRRSQGGDQ